MSKKKKKAIPKKREDEEMKSDSLKDIEVIEDEAFDFGGLPKNVSLKRNIGCGG